MIVSLFLDIPACEAGVKQIQDVLESVVDLEDGNAISDKLAKLADIQGFSSHVMASCEYQKGENKSSNYLKALFTLAERLNSALGKSITSYQSVLGKIREEKTRSRYGS